MTLSWNKVKFDWNLKGIKGRLWSQDGGTEGAKLWAECNKTGPHNVGK